SPICLACAGEPIPPRTGSSACPGAARPNVETTAHRQWGSFRELLAKELRRWTSPIFWTTPMAHVLDRLQQRVVNPVVKLAWDLRLPIPGDALLETTGRRTGLPRRTPVCDGLDGESFWLVAQRGHAADWVRNIEANPRVRVKLSGFRSHWRAGT